VTPVTGTTFSFQHSYQPGTGFPVTAKVKVMDANGRLGSDTVVVRLLCDPIGDSTLASTDFVSCHVASTASTISIAIRVVGTLSPQAQYRLNLKTATFNGQVKYDNGTAGGPLQSLVVTFADPSELVFTFSRAEVGLASSGQLQWSAAAQQGLPGHQSAGFTDNMPDTGYFTVVIP
jgi:hypothetical protein